MIKDATRIGVYGASGFGKSTRVREIIKDERRIVVFDPLGEYGGRGRFTTCRALADVLAGLRRGWSSGFRLAYMPPVGHEPEALHRLALVLIQAQRPYFEGKDGRKLTLVVEEMNLSFPVSSLPREVYGFAELCSRGRHYGVSIIGVTQRLAEVNTRWRGNTGSAYFFRQGDHVDAGAAVKMIGPTWRPKLAALAKHEFLLFEGGNVKPGRNSLKTP